MAEQQVGTPSDEPVRERTSLARELAPAQHVQEGILERQDRLRATRLPLACASSHKLAINASCVVALRQDHKEPAAFGYSRAEANVDAASGHVGGDRDATDLAGLGDDLRLVCILSRVED